MIILVYPINNNKNIIKTNIIKSNCVICPTCKETCKYEIKNHIIKLYGCKNEHTIENIKLDDFNNTQNIDISQIKCDKCKIKSLADIFNNEFYICFQCKMNLCPLCKSMHDDTHSLINYDKKNFLCNKHNEVFFKYCKNCEIDLCLSCLNEHKNHRVESYENKLIDIKKMRILMNNLKASINKFKMNLEEIIKKFKKLQENLDLYYNINNNILNDYEKNKNINYNVLISLSNINNNIAEEISKIIGEYSYGNNLNTLLYLYNEINDKNIEIELKYKRKKREIKEEKEEENKKTRLRIFGDILLLII